MQYCTSNIASIYQVQRVSFLHQDDPLYVRLHERFDKIERLIDPKATMEAAERSAAKIHGLEQSLASSAEIASASQPILQALARLEERMVALENRPQGCWAVS